MTTGGAVSDPEGGILFAANSSSLTIRGQSADYETNGSLTVKGSDSDDADGKPAIGDGYSHVTTDPDQTEVYERTGKAAADGTWSKTALKIQPLNINLAVTAEYTDTEDENSPYTGSATVEVKLDNQEPDTPDPDTPDPDNPDNLDPPDTVTVTELRVKAQPDLSYVSGEALDLSQLVLEIVYSDGTAATRSYPFGGISGIVFTPAHGTVLSYEQHNGKYISISYGGKSVQAGPLEVSYVQQVEGSFDGKEGRVVVDAGTVSGGNTAVYDVVLQLRESSGTAWTDATPENFPQDGLTLTLPYPAGSTKHHVFTVIHMFTTGERAGQTEQPTVTNTDEGIRFTVTGLSPIAVAWKAAGSSSEEGDGGAGGENGGSGGGSGSSDGNSGQVVYPPAIGKTANGTVSVSPSSPGQGDRVTVAPAPNVGYEVGTAAVKYRSGNMLDVRNNGDGMLRPTGQAT